MSHKTFFIRFAAWLIAFAVSCNLLSALPCSGQEIARQMSLGQSARAHVPGNFFTPVDVQAEQAVWNSTAQAIQTNTPIWYGEPSIGGQGMQQATGVATPITFREVVWAQGNGIVSDYCEFYSPRGLSWLGGGVIVGALMANTTFDEQFLRQEYVEHIVEAPNDEIYEKTHQAKFFGNGLYSIPVFAVLAMAAPVIHDWPQGANISEWGQRSLRIIVLGAPPMLALQVLTGGSRPGETDAQSRWKPFQDSNGVSGHSFMGAIPFMAAAKMSNNYWLKGGLYALSALPAMSRVNDDDHYFSQAFLGWWIAYVAATAVDYSFQPVDGSHWRIYPMSEGFGVSVEARW